MNIDEMTYGELKQIAAMFATKQADCTHPLLGKNAIVRTVTMIFTGKLVEVTPTDLVLVDCSWIPCTDRYMNFVAEGSVQECEPYPDGLPVYINRGALLDVCELKKSLPRSPK